MSSDTQPECPHVLVGAIPNKTNCARCVCTVCKDEMLIELPVRIGAFCSTLAMFTRMHRFCDRKAALSANV
jgi:hypothetical protein